MTGVLNNMKDVFINKDHVELFKILKFEGIASSGAEAKEMIAVGTVLVNGVIEKKKRKKMVSGDTIELKGEIFRLKLSAN
ncbi:MAG TPA: RNA-binding S4 domain-containing protein [Legionella sp.]|nr:RNA-binding S4 domain-containing protein [Legionella sp.]